jgi:hypothetical protein
MLLGILEVIFLLLTRGDGRTTSARTSKPIALIIFVALPLLLAMGCQH